MIVVFGSINADLFFYVKSLPGRGETTLCPEFEIFTGGKGANQAVAAARAGTESRMVGRVGDDVFAGQVLKDIESKGVDVQRFGKIEGKTGTAMVAVEDSGENQIIVASGANLSVDASDVPTGWLGPDTVLVLQMEIPVRENERIIDLAREAGCQIILNLAPAADISEAALSKVDILIVNEIEAGHLTGPGKPAQDMAGTLCGKYGLSTIVTLGGKGALIAEESGEMFKIGTLAIDPVDTVGAGDTFVGALAAQVDQGATLVDAAHWASVAAGLACLEKGAQTAPKSEIVKSRLSDLEAPEKLR